MKRPAPSFLLALLAGFALLAVAAPARATQVSVTPADTTVLVGSTFRLRVTADAFPDLKGCQLVFSYDPARLLLTNVLPGDVLTAGGSYAAYWLPDAIPPFDTAWLDEAVLTGSASGTGVLAYLEFKAITEGVSPIPCVHVELRDSVNAWTFPACVPGLVRIVGPVAVAPRSWGGLKLIYR